MLNVTNKNADQKSKNSKSALTVVAAAICGFVGFLLSYKLVMAVAAALGWFSLYAVTHIEIVQVLQASVFAIAWSFWAFKRLTPHKAMIWQTIVCLVEWIPLCIVAFALNGSAPIDFLVYTFCISVALGALSGFVTGWTMPHLLAWLQKSSQRPEPPSFSHPSHDVSYHIEG